MGNVEPGEDIEQCCAYTARPARDDGAPTLVAEGMLNHN